MGSADSTRVRLLVAAVVAAGAACSPPPGADGPLAGRHVLLVNVDTLRADHLGAYGYERETSPFLDRLAAEGVVFEDAVANSSYTRESVAALFTGQLPSRSGASGWHAAPPDAAPHLAERLRAAGYRTGFLSNTVMLTQQGFTRGFDVVQHLPRRWDLSGMGPRLSERALAFAETADARPFFLYLHYLDPHAPYAPDAAFRARVGGPAHDPPLALYDDVEPRLGALRDEGFGPGDSRFDDLVARYDAEIAATDAALEQLHHGLAARGLLARTLWVVTADHGEEFLEHGWVEHGWTLHRESIHVPLLFWAPGGLAPARVAAPVSQLDLLPTLLALLGLPAGAAELDGRALFDAAGRPVGEPRPRVAELLIPRRNVVRAVMHDGWKYVVAQRWVPPERRGQRPPKPVPRVESWGPPVYEALYHVRADPDERHDRLAEEPERRRALRALLAEQVASGRPLPDPAQAPAVDPEQAERLRALGYH